MITISKTKKTPFAPWETTKTNGIENRYIRMASSQMAHPSLLGLSHIAFRVYAYMKLESGGQREFEFPRSKWIGYLSPGGFQKAKKELTDFGLIKVVKQNANLRKANVYAFSDQWKLTEIK